MSSASTTVPSSTGSSASTSSPNQLTSGTNYFFGFLIAFIAFLFVFLSLGLLARRRRMRLMREFLLYGPDDGSDVPQTEPIMWQPTYAEAKGQLWSDVVPVAASWVRREVADDANKQPEPERPSRNPFVVYFGFPAMKPLRRHRRRKTEVTEGLRVAVMISMPQAPDAVLVSEEGERHPPEYQLGTLQVPWTDDTLSQTTPIPSTSATT